MDVPNAGGAERRTRVRARPHAVQRHEASAVPRPNPRSAPRPLRWRKGVRGGSEPVARKLPARPEGRGALRPRQMRLNTSVPLVPPNPKPLDIATSIFFSRATFGT